ncbi:bifunctional folylpolyglutamate synthase/dihydrofolate synthase [Sphingomonas piscis]|uniref:Dihydrofolate synthase/folylpolyglutamate synthase n=1 Tax=Sphingomonas piscis TaxID=2714943 RepID=A0A6G7YQR0_9SPHN|nr:folylpolyglutamate synthase/dihydrofolate synthase family protein [Sphingomonas piscis]QIK79072.1 bifunctional folylpolyglutamate synthase/dihydrofolate synthase [Sphingomonas piscis]
MADFARSDHPAVQEQLDRLSLLSPGGDRLGLDRITRLLDKLGRPQDDLPPVFHVAGTNGKGSTCAFLRAALEAAGKSVHVFTSPHLVRFNERIRVTGSLIGDEVLASLLAEVLDAGEAIEPSFFEVTTAAAFLAFARTQADACILEVGLGGRLDATNVIERPLITGIASLGLDHQQFLGNRLPDIAAEKAGIAKRGVPLVTQLYPPAIGGRIGKIAEDVGAIWSPRGARWDAIVERKTLRYRDEQGELDLPIPRLPGRHQALNAALAVALLRHQQRISFPPSALTAAMGWSNWPARLQQLTDGPLSRGRDVWIDGGHNPSAARLVAGWAKRQFRDRRLHLIFASLKSKDAAGVLQPFGGIAPSVSTLPITGHDCRSPEELAAMATELGFAASVATSLEDAIAAAPTDAAVLVFGSLYLAGEALKLNGQLPD